MKKLGRITVFSLLALFFVISIASTASAHYVWIEAPTEVTEGETVSIDSFWGHMGDDRASFGTTEVNTFIQTPNGIIEEISFSNRGNFLTGRASLNDSGTYQVYAIRPASVYQRSLGQHTAKSYINVTGDDTFKAWNSLLVYH
ncbi:DUF4198 domain-containing protein [Natroniella acetigena]|uniref:DUF4198 domain-containing protein n=1 Tax=Natroniella acetigena TaxID=52004 RepID=UPI00200AC1BD|nr:DUF4198 domain-containing protein [Natroniella acetigena]MCK8826495.1 DUF4198 domain-containing protein [Natroniella acetigena]